ncbi:hypothetical protein E1B28_004840 [Marasmius oreades]|uniref:Thioesterase domain-containing protein n=1 Tax=Marasmius oreades TaxID=181124 RepID=A0A9P8ADI1_9AGAR|nr:uncharacterized protein E1B28_004840 [Marasmius oreades]KAG7097498.1 hypothetical protein E1B28_004840 [Marasmius oreades]
MSLNPHEIGGNCSLETKQRIVDTLASHVRHGVFAGSTVASKLRVSEVTVGQMREDPLREEGRAVFTLTVDEDMMNLAGGVHGGCIAYLIDFCSSLALAVLAHKQTGDRRVISVSQALNIVYHSPAPLGDKLRIINTTMTVGKRASSIRSEIWSDVNHRLIASGVHVKMDPSPLKAKI